MPCFHFCWVKLKNDNEWIHLINTFQFKQFPTRFLKVTLITTHYKTPSQPSNKLVFIPTCAWVLGRWLLSLSPNVFLQFSSHYRVGRRGEGDRQDGRKKKQDTGLGEERLVTEAIQGLLFFSFGRLHLHLCAYIIKVGQGGDLISVLYLAN